MCVVCADTRRGPSVPLVCGHVFHLACVSDWRQNSPACPLCRAPMRVDLSLSAGAAAVQKRARDVRLRQARLERAVERNRRRQCAVERDARALECLARQ